MSARDLVGRAQALSQGQTRTLIDMDIFPFSARYYTQGRVISASKGKDDEHWLKPPGTMVILSTSALNSMSEDIHYRLIASQGKAALIEIVPNSDPSPP